MFKRLSPTVFALTMILTVLASVSFAQENEMTMNNDLPRPEYPRPIFQRDAWLNLNGTWDFVFDPDDQGLVAEWFAPQSSTIQDAIVVPFPWQSELSGIHNRRHTGVAWYRRTFAIPDSWTNQRTVLHFGAVDYFAEVWINGQFVGAHEGGYTPFEFDITDYLQPGDNVVTVRVNDPANLWEIPHGKQRNNLPDPWDDVDFTTVSGIWQTVWLEARPAAYIQRAHITPDVPNERALFEIEIASPSPGDLELHVDVQAPDGRTFSHVQPLTFATGGSQTVTFPIDLPEPLLWDIDTPHLYQVDLTLGPSNGEADVVHTYFGMRSIEVNGRDVLLNGRPIYLMSALVQGYWPEGLYTAPSDEALRSDIEYAKRIGLNGLRMHIKIEDPRWAYWADHLGLLLWNDGPSPVSFTELARERLMRDMGAMIERDYNHPSIVIWCPYNESWGLEFRSDRAIQEHLIDVYDQIKASDPTRLVVDNSGWRHVKTDIADSHVYTGDSTEWRGVMTLLENDPMTLQVLGHPFFAFGRKYSGQPLMMSEYGTGWVDDRSWDFKWQTNEIRRHGGVVGYTYTELYDIEHEMAGYARYDRTPKDFGYDLAMINDLDFAGFDYRGDVTLKPGDTLEVPIFVSAYGLPALSSGTVRWRLETIEPTPAVLVEGSYDDIVLEPFSVTNLESITLTVPGVQGPVKLWLEVLDDDGGLRAQNYLDFEIFESALPRAEIKSVEGHPQHILRITLDDYTAETFPVGPHGRRLDGMLQILEGGRTGYVEYRLPSPEDETWESLTLAVEVGSMPDWPVQAAEDLGYPSEITMSVNGVELATWQIPNRPINALGALTRLNGLGVGEHGYWMEATASTSQLATIRERAQAEQTLIVRFEVKEDAKNQGGLTLFGARAGRYGRDPEIRITVMPE